MLFPWIRRRQVLTVVACLSVTAMVFFLYSCRSRQPEVSEGLQAPSLEVRDTVSGRKVNIEQYKGKVIFVNFWATWCPPCREELPSIEALHRDFFSDSRFALITILYKDTPKSALDFMKANGYSFPVYADHDGATSRRYKVTGVPETYVVDKKGILRKKIIGALDWSAADARAFINNLLIE